MTEKIPISLIERVADALDTELNSNLELSVRNEELRQLAIEAISAVIGWGKEYDYILITKQTLRELQR